MSSKVLRYSNETLGMVETEDEYRDHIVVQELVQDFMGTYTANVPVFIHEPTGIVVTDPLKFESWLRSIR